MKALNPLITFTLKNNYNIKNIDALINWTSNEIDKLNLGTGGNKELKKYLNELRLMNK